MPTRLVPPDRPSHDPLGFAQDSIDYLPQRMPRQYPGDTCRCEDCVQHFCTMYAIRNYDASNYRSDNRTRRWTQTAFTFTGSMTPADHPRRPSRWSSYAQETPLPTGISSVLNHPLRFMLRRSGRVWSAEVEVNDISTDQAANVLGVSMGRYSTRPDRATIVASPDVTVDAEIKISCMRDGSSPHAEMARNAYATLVQHGATCAVNAGHHVHMDATRLADAGTETAEQVMRAVWTTARVCRSALVPLAASGYSKHRGSSLAFHEGSMMTGRQAVHASRLWHAARSNNDLNATIEYRLPNATLSPLRAQSFIALPLGILDFAERAILDEDDVAASYWQQIQDRYAHAAQYDELEATSLLLKALRLSKDSKKAIAIAAYTSPSTHRDARVLWEEACEGLPSISKMFEREVERIARTTTPPSVGRVRGPDGRFMSSAEAAEAERIQLAYMSIMPQPAEPGDEPFVDGDDYDEPDYYDNDEEEGF